MPRAVLEAGEAVGRPPIVDVLRDAIRQRLLAPGMPLVQSALAEALGVSKIPVREALHTLASEGLVTFGEDGARVVELRPDEVHELWSLRALLEPALAEAIVRNVGPAELRELERLVEAMEDAEGDAWCDLNYGFHVELARVARLPHYAAATVRVLTLIEPYSRVAVDRLAAQPDAQAEHRAMATAIHDRDAAELARVLERHAIRARDLLVEYAEEEQRPGSRANPTTQAARAFAARLFASPAERA